MGDREFKRADRVAERIRAELMDLVIRGAIRHPDARGVLVSDVKVTDDLRHARVYLRLQDPRVGERRQQAAVDAMTRAGRFLRGELGKRLGTKYTPDLEFFWDEVIDRAQRIEALMDEIRAEEGGDET